MSTLASIFEGVKIFLLAILAAIVYGILHDQVTARVCMEYFSIGHPPIFRTQSPTLMALGWGVIATWWVGAILGVPLAMAARLGTRQPATWRDVIRPTIALMVTMGVLAAGAGMLGYALAWGRLIWLTGPISWEVPAAKHAAFLACLWSHLTSYAVGLIGGLVLIWTVSRARRFNS